MASEEEVQILERGNVYFFYRPKVGEFAPEGLEDIQRFYIILNPEGKQFYRLMVIAEKKMPSSEQLNKKGWGYVEM